MRDAERHMQRDTFRERHILGFGGERLEWMIAVKTLERERELRVTVQHSPESLFEYGYGRC